MGIISIIVNSKSSEKGCSYTTIFETFCRFALCDHKKVVRSRKKSEYLETLQRADIEVGLEPNNGVHKISRIFDRL